MISGAGSLLQALLDACAAPTYPAKVVGDREANHNTLNANLGVPGDLGTKELWSFVDSALQR